MENVRPGTHSLRVLYTYVQRTILLTKLSDGDDAKGGFGGQQGERVVQGGDRMKMGCVKERKTEEGARLF